MKFIIFFFLLSIVFLVPEFGENSFANHGSSGGGGGGGCSGDCIPPTLGIDEYNKQRLSGGFSINGESFAVENFKQSIPTQIIEVGKPVEISLEIYENSGAFYLSHVNLILGEKEEYDDGQLVTLRPVQIIWEKELDGEESFFTIDKNKLISNVNVESFVDGDPTVTKITTLTFTFTPVDIFDSSPVLVTMWDYNRSSWTNYFLNALEIGTTSSKPGQMAFSENKDLVIPSWIKSNAGFWASGLIDDSSFVMGIKYCMDNEIIHIPNLPKHTPENVLHFVDSDKGPQHYIDRYYAEPSYKEWFDVNFPDYTIEEAVGMTSDSQHKIPNWIKNNAEWWADGQIDDDAFVNGIEYLVENGILIV